jgi:aminoglycoside 3-N-acetyltransferase
VWGERAAQLINGQPWSYPFGAGSILERFHDANGKILLLGSDHDNVTFLHYSEHVAEFADKRIARFKVPVLRNGERVWIESEEVDTSSQGAHANWPDRFFARIVWSCVVANGIESGRIGDAKSWLIPARELHAHAKRIMEAVAVDARAADSLRPLD